MTFQFNFMTTIISLGLFIKNDEMIFLSYYEAYFVVAYVKQGEINPIFLALLKTLK